MKKYDVLSVSSDAAAVVTALNVINITLSEIQTTLLAISSSAISAERVSAMRDTREAVQGEEVVIEIPVGLATNDS